MENPYGAVPAALKDTRLTLRDIAADILMTKKQEADLSLARSKADTETAMVNSGIVRDQLHNNLQMSSLSEASRHNMATEDNDTSQIDIARQNADTNAMIGKSTANLHNAQAKLGNIQAQTAQDEANRLRKVDTVANWAKQLGAEALIPLTGRNPNALMSGRDVEDMKKEIAGYISTNPAVKVTAIGMMLKSDIEKINDQLQQPNTPQITKQLKDAKTAKLSQMNDIATLSNYTHKPDTTKLAEIYARYKDTSLSNFPDFASYEQSVRAGSTSIQDSFSQIKTRMAMIDIDPAYDDKMNTYLNIIRQSPDKKLIAQIEQGIKNRNNRGDVRDALEYAYAHATNVYVQTKPGTGIKPSGATPQTPMPSAGIARLRDAASLVKSGISTAWDYTGGAANSYMQNRTNEQTAAAAQEIAALKQAGNLTPSTMEQVQRKYPYAQIQ